MRDKKRLLELLRDYYSQNEHCDGIVYITRDMWRKTIITYAEQMYLDSYLFEEMEEREILENVEDYLYSKSSHEEHNRDRLEFINKLITEL